jgi:glycosyltransferase involved in cell wall biosynthesis
MAFFKDAQTILSKILASEQVDLITAEDYLMGGLAGWILKKKFKIPLNIQVNDGRIDNPYWLGERGKNRLLNVIGKFTLKRADTIRVVSERTKRDLVRVGIASERIFVVPTVVNTVRFIKVDGSAIRNKYLGQKFDRIVLFVGRLSQEKDIPTILRAMKQVVAKHPSVLLLIVGGGPQEQNLKSQINKLGINNNVVFSGSVDYEEIPKYFACADIFVLSSLHEGRANVLVEAGLSRKPIIASNVGDADQYVVDGKTGFVFESGDEGKLAEKINFFLNNSAMIKEFGDAGFDHIQKRMTEYNDPKNLIRCWEATKGYKRL